MPKLSILILTHNRPELFKRCLKSALHSGVEIIINNDSWDVECPDGIKLFHKQGSLTSKYKFLVEQASGDYVYFLEDDDILFPGFFKCLGYLNGKDAYCGSYYSYDQSLGPTKKRIKFDPNFEFQLSQVIFKKSCLRFDNLVECSDGSSCIYNDYYLFVNCVKDYEVLNTMFYRQTCDGGDNISDDCFTNLDKCLQCKFSRKEFD